MLKEEYHAWIFVSHASDDLARVREVRNYLESKGASPLLFHLLAMKRPDEFWPIIEREIEARNFFLYCESPIAEEREWVRRERAIVERVRKEKPVRVGAIRVDTAELAFDELDRFIAKTRVFPTFAHRDREQVGAFLQALEKAGFQVFKEIDVPLGTSFKDAIEREVKLAAENGWVVAFLRQPWLATSSRPKSIWLRRWEGSSSLLFLMG